MATPSPLTDPDRLAIRNATGPTGGVADAKVAAAADADDQPSAVPRTPQLDPDDANGVLQLDGESTRFKTEHDDWTAATGGNGQRLAIETLGQDFPAPEEP